MKLSIVIPYYNSERYISRCVDSLLSQGMEVDDYEIIIINDGSPNDSLVLANQYAQNHSNIHIYHKENGGVGSARNRGIELAKGDYLYILDVDDYLASHVFKLILDTCEKNKLDVLTFLSTTTTRPNLYESKTKLDSDFFINKMDGPQYMAKFGFQNVAWGYVVKKGVLINNGIRFIEGIWFEDAIFSADLFLRAKSIAHIPIDVHRYVVNPGSAMTSKEPKHYVKTIYDMEKVAIAFDPRIKSINNDSQINKECIDQLRARQHSFTLFLMIRALKSQIKLFEVKAIIKTLKSINAYPIISFPGRDYFNKTNIVISKIFNVKYAYFLMFFLLHQFFKIKNYLELLADVA